MPSDTKTVPSLYEQGFIHGLWAYAISKNGQQVIGNDRPLKTCIERVRATWNFDPEMDRISNAHDDLVAALEAAVREAGCKYESTHWLENAEAALAKAKAKEGA